MRHPMYGSSTRFASFLLFTAFATACTGPGTPAGEQLRGYEDLVAFFTEWREFERPNFVDGVPDYSAAAMELQHRELADYQRRLTSMDTTGWSVAQQVDYHVVRAEMNGLDFYHRVYRPWSRDPAFYTVIHAAQSDVPAHEGPVLHGWIDLWTYDFPLSSSAAAELSARIRAIPPLLEQAKANLVDNARGLWMAGIRAMRGQSSDLAALGQRVAGTSAELDANIESARAATDEFVDWLESEAPTKTGPSGIGVDDYNWYLRHVHLVPYTWEEELTVMQRDLARSFTALALEEHRNRDLPPLSRIDDASEYDRLFSAAVSEYIAFLRDEEIISMRDYMDHALRERIGQFSPADGLRGFFSEVSYRDPLTMRTHGHHWFDLAMMDREPHPSPIRRVPLLYNIWDSRAEGMATGMEEWMMQAGLFANSPRSRELIYVLVAQRAARAISGLRLHSNEFTMEQAVKFAAEWTPRGWMPEESNTVWGEQFLYLRQPYYGSSYLMGKYEIEQLLAESVRQLGEDFTLKGFMDDINASGLIPMSLIRWEMTGQVGQVLGMAER